MLGDLEVRFVVEQPVNQIRRLRRRGADRGCVIRTVLVGQMGVQLHARRRSVVGVDLANRRTPSADGELLGVRGRRGAFAPVSGEWVSMLSVDDRCQSMTPSY